MGKSRSDDLRLALERLVKAAEKADKLVQEAIELDGLKIGEQHINALQAAHLLHAAVEQWEWTSD